MISRIAISMFLRCGMIFLVAVEVGCTSPEESQQMQPDQQENYQNQDDLDADNSEDTDDQEQYQGEEGDYQEGQGNQDFNQTNVDDLSENGNDQEYEQNSAENNYSLDDQIDNGSTAAGGALINNAELEEQGYEGEISNIAIDDEPPVAEPVPVEPSATNSVVVYDQPAAPMENRFYGDPMLTWIGLDYQKVAATIEIVMLIEGPMAYSLAVEENASNQIELVFKFVNLRVRQKLWRKINATEFPSPVSHIRVRKSSSVGADVILTMRDAVRPTLTAKAGRIALRFGIPERYGQIKFEEKLPDALATGRINVLPIITAGSDLPENLESFGELAFADPAAVSAVAEQEVEPPAVDQPVISNQYQNNANEDRVFSGSGDQYINNFGTEISRQANNQQGANGQQYNNQGAGKNNQYNQNVNSNQEYTNGQYNKNQQSNDQYENQENQNQQQNDEYEDEQDLEGQENYGALSGSRRLHVRGGEDFQILREISIFAVGQDDGGNDEFDDFQQQYESGNENENVADENQRNEFDDYENENQNVNENGESEESGNNYGGNSQGSDFQAEADYDNQYNDQAATLDNEEPVNEVVNEAVVGADLDEAPPLEPAAVNQEIIGQEVAEAPQPASAKLVSLEFYDTRLDHVLKVFSEEGNVNFVFPREIAKRRVSTRLKGVPWDEALKAILATESLAMVEVGPNVIRIDGAEKIRKDLIETQKRKKAESVGVPTKVLVMRLSHARAEDMVKHLLGFQQKSSPNPTEVTPDQKTLIDLLSFKASADRRTNSVVIEAVPQVLTKIKNLVERLDVPVPQAEISTKIVEMQKDISKFVGVNWTGGINADGSNGLAIGNLVFPNSLTAPFAIDTGTPTPQVGDLRYRLGSLNDVIDLDLRLRLQESHGNVEILQSGKVVVQDGGTARIAAGTSVYIRPVQVIGQQVNEKAGKLEKVDLNLKLEVGYFDKVKHGISVSRDGHIRIPVRLHSYIPTTTGIDAAVAALSRELQTEIVRRSGDTAVIGGIYNTTKRKVVTGLPGISKLPIIGALFRSTSVQDTQTELLIMLTPKIIDPSLNGGEVAADSGPSYQYENYQGNYEASANAGSNGANASQNNIQGGNQYNNFNNQGANQNNGNGQGNGQYNQFDQANANQGEENEEEF